MPSQKPLPTIADFVDVARKAVRGTKDRLADTRVGSVYDLFAGVAAMIWSEQAVRDRDMARSTYYDFAEGDQLDDRVEQGFGLVRVRDAYGTGTARLARTSTAAGAGTVWAGTRLLLATGTGVPRVYVVSADTAVGATEKTATVPIRGNVIGPGTTCSATSGATVDDPLWDTWTVSEITCGEGTTYEGAKAYLARARASRVSRRKGSPEAIVQACKDAGATQVVLCSSMRSGLSNDRGISAVYVGDSSYGATSDLVSACRVAVESARVAGADLWVGGMQTTTLAVDLTATTWDDPSKLDRRGLTSRIRDAVGLHFTSATNAFTLKRDALAGTILRVTGDLVAGVTFTAPAADATLTPDAWPATLTRYVVQTNTVGVTLAAP